MPDPQNSLPPLPAGYENYKPVQSAPSTPAQSSLPPLPAGYENYKPVQQQAPNYSDSASTFGQAVKGVGNAVVEGGKQIYNDVAGATDLANKVIAPGAPATPKMTPDSSTSGMLGRGAADIAEFAGGDELLKGVAALSHLGQTPEILDLMEKYPKASKIVTSMLRGGAVGGAQGASRGAPKGEATKEGLEGMAGGAVGSGVGTAASEFANPLMKILGVGGLNYEEAMTKAGKPYVAEHNWKQALEIAKDRISKFDPKQIKNLDDFTDMLGQEAQNIRNTEFGPMIQKHANVVVSTQPIAGNIRSAITPQMQKYAPEEAKEIDEFAKLFDGANKTTLAEAEKDLQFFNTQLSKFYKAAPRDARGMLMTNGTIAKYEAAADGLRDTIYSHVKNLQQASGVASPVDLEKLQKEYGSLKDLERVFNKRATVEDRQNPLSLHQILAYAGGMTEAAAALTKNPAEAVVGAVPIAVSAAAKVRNSGKSLVKQAISAANPDSALVSGTKAVAKAGAEAAGGAAGAEATEQVGSTPE